MSSPEITDLLTKILRELQWQTHFLLREIDTNSIGTTQTLQPGVPLTIYTKGGRQQGGRAGEIIYGVAIVTSDSFTMRLTVDDFAPITLPEIEDLIAGGATTPNNVLWGQSLAGGTFSMNANLPFSFKKFVKLEAINTDVVNISLLGSDVVARLRDDTV